MRSQLLVLLLCLTLPLCAAADEAETKRRRAYLTELLTALPPSPHWNAWLQRTGELPPDFSQMPSSVELPDPLVARGTGERRRITNVAEWERCRTQLKQQLQHYVTGSLPPAPGNVSAELLAERREGEVTTRRLVLRFGPGQRGRLHVSLFIPTGDGPFPVFIGTNPAWTAVAVRRGYLGCLVAASDRQDDTEAFARLYPDYDFTCLARRAWGISRAIDYLVTLEIVGQDQITLSDHSRGGKMSTWAAAFDERLTAVVGSSSVTGGSLAWRHATDRYANETLEQITRNYPHWFHPRLRFFAGRENKLPVDMHEMVSLVAPRAYMITLGTHEYETNPWGEQRSFLAAERVYQLLDAEEKLALRFRPGGHRPSPADIEAYFDWFDIVLGRAAGESPDRLLYDFSYEHWLQQVGPSFDPTEFPPLRIHDLLSTGSPLTEAHWTRKRAEIRDRVLDVLGQAPPRSPVTPPRQLVSTPPGSTPRPREPMRPPATESVDCARLTFAGINGALYYPRKVSPDRKLPVVIFLHSYAHSRGYSVLPITEDTARSAAYLRGSSPLGAGGYMGTDFRAGPLAEQDFAVFTFDLAGFGMRQSEAHDFYGRHPDWSLLGKMVDDVHAAVDLLTQSERINGDAVFIAGYSLGGTVALYAAALDERIRGVCAFSAFTPMRLETPEKGTGHLLDLAQLHGMLPQLGSFVDQPARLPYDYHELLALIAPRPLLIVAPRLDQEADFAAVRDCIHEVRRVYELLDPDERERLAFEPDWSGQWRAPEQHTQLRRLELYAPDGFNPLLPRVLSVMNYWMRLQWLR